MSVRGNKIAGLIKKLAAEFLAKEADKTSMITITYADISNDFKNVIVYFTVYPKTSEKAALLFVKRKRGEFKKYAKEKIRMKKIPFFNFEIDIGEKNK